MKFRNTLIEGILWTITIIGLTVFIAARIVSHRVALEICDDIEMISELTESGMLTPTEDNENLLLSHSGANQILSAFAGKANAWANTLGNIELVSALCVSIAPLAQLAQFVILIIQFINRNKKSE